MTSEGWENNMTTEKNAISQRKFHQFNDRNLIWTVKWNEWQESDGACLIATWHLLYAQNMFESFYDAFVSNE